MQANTIDEVIDILEAIIEESKTNQNPLGYFAALYQKVTIQVKTGIENDFFDDGDRMEKLDVIFANRYLKAYFDHQDNKSISEAWQRTFEQSNNYWPIVLQHLLLGMNAHINLDLGIAAAGVSKNTDLDHLKDDFNKINGILSSLAHKVETELSQIWPTLKKILQYTRKVDGFFVDFSMKLARDGAWLFAKQLHEADALEYDQLIETKDQKVSKNTHLIINDSWIVKLIFKIIRLGERGTVSEKITVLEKKI